MFWCLGRMPNTGYARSLAPWKRTPEIGNGKQKLKSRGAGFAVLFGKALDIDVTFLYWYKDYDANQQRLTIVKCASISILVSALGLPAYNAMHGAVLFTRLQN